jgi:hypothetical protein
MIGALLVDWAWSNGGLEVKLTSVLSNGPGVAASCHAAAFGAERFRA